jgi:hypothetical protein
MLTAGSGRGKQATGEVRPHGTVTMTRFFVPGFSERIEDFPIEQLLIRPRFDRKRLFLGQVLWQADAMLFDRILSNDP